MAKESNDKRKGIDNFGYDQLYKAESAMRGMSDPTIAWGQGRGEFLERPRIREAVHEYFPEDKTVIKDAVTLSYVSGDHSISSVLPDILPNDLDTFRPDPLETPEITPPPRDEAPDLPPPPVPNPPDRGFNPPQPPGPAVPFRPEQPKVKVETNATGRVGDGRPDKHTPNFFGQEQNRVESTDGELNIEDSARLASDSLNQNMFAIIVVLEQMNVNQKALTERLNILIDKTDSEDDEDEF